MPSEKVLNQKKQIVAELTETLKNAQAGVLFDYRGLTVEEDTKLRNDLRAAGVEYHVVKNTLTRFASKEVGLEELDPVLHGPDCACSFVYGRGCSGEGACQVCKGQRRCQH